MTTAPTTTPMPRRRRLQFSLRTLMVLVLVISVPLGWVGMKLKQARKQREFVRRIEQLGGSVMYSWESIERHRGRRSDGIRGMFRQLLGEDVLATVDGLTLANCGIEDDDLKWLSGFPNLEYLRLANTPISDAGVAYVVGLDNLRRMDLSNTRISDASAAHLSNLRGLRLLYVYGTNMTPQGAAQLRSSLPDCAVVFTHRKE